MSDSSDPMDCSLPGSSVHGIFQARVLEWDAIVQGMIFLQPLSKKFSKCFKNTVHWKREYLRSDPSDFTVFILFTKANHLSVKLKWKSPSHVRLWDPMDDTVHGIRQARILEWVDFPFSRGSFQPKDRTQVSHTAGRFFTTWATRKPNDKQMGPI